MKETSANPEYAGSHTSGVDKKAAPFNNNPGKCEDQLKESCKCGAENCDCDWASQGIGKGEDPKQIGWDMEGQTVVNEEEDWASQGLPSTPGVGEADTDHNNAPFTNTINEDEEFDAEAEDVEVDDINTDDIDLGTEEDEVESFDVEDFDDNAEFGGEEMPEEEEGDEDLMARIAELEAELEALKAQVGGEEPFETEGEDDIDMDIDAEPVEDSEEVSEFEADFDNVDDSEFEGEEPLEGEESFDDEMDECGNMSLMEAKTAYMNKIVESVVSTLIKEDELHVFGKHPGYQKKPMELPTTGEDNNTWGEDWNDESVYSEEPFGTKIGDSAPFSKLVDAVTKDVMTKISGDAFKKKVK